jgi:hypothetical protein
MDKQQRVNRAFHLWQDCRAKLQASSQQLEKALEAYAAGNGPLPSDLTEEVRARRLECDNLFQRVLDAVASPPDKA